MDSCDGHGDKEINLAYTQEEQKLLWDLINKYAEACGGDTGLTTVSDTRMMCVSKIGHLIEDMFQQRLGRALAFQKTLR
jgi:hypothetical protein